MITRIYMMAYIFFYDINIDTVNVNHDIDFNDIKKMNKRRKISDKIFCYDLHPELKSKIKLNIASNYQIYDASGCKITCFSNYTPEDFGGNIKLSRLMSERFSL